MSQRNEYITQSNGHNGGIHQNARQRQHQNVGRQAYNGGAVEINAHGQHHHCLGDGRDHNQVINHEDYLEHARGQNPCGQLANEPAGSSGNQTQIQTQLRHARREREVIACRVEMS